MNHKGLVLFYEAGFKAELREAPTMGHKKSKGATDYVLLRGGFALTAGRRGGAGAGVRGDGARAVGGPGGAACFFV